MRALATIPSRGPTAAAKPSTAGRGASEQGRLDPSVSARRRLEAHWLSPPRAPPPSTSIARWTRARTVVGGCLQVTRAASPSAPLLLMLARVALALSGISAAFKGLWGWITLSLLLRAPRVNCQGHGHGPVSCISRPSRLRLRLIIDSSYRRPLPLAHSCLHSPEVI
jgi:hypothetical protein